MATESLLVSELFYSIQGESTRAGLACLFIRLAGCNLRCSWCDARYTWEEPGTVMTVAEVLAWAASTPEVPVEVTGGEPLIQPGVYPLINGLLEAGRNVLLETNGSLPLCAVPDAVVIIMDVKCPGSGMTAHNLEENIGYLRERRRRGCRDEIKFVLSSENDFSWADCYVRKQRLESDFPILFSPVQPTFAPRELARLLMANQSPARLQLQLHTLLWPEKKRGV